MEKEEEETTGGGDQGLHLCNRLICKELRGERDAERNNRGG